MKLNKLLEAHKAHGFPCGMDASLAEVCDWAGPLIMNLDKQEAKAEPPSLPEGWVYHEDKQRLVQPLSGECIALDPTCTPAEIRQIADWLEAQQGEEW